MHVVVRVVSVVRVVRRVIGGLEIFPVHGIAARLVVVILDS